MMTVIRNHRADNGTQDCASTERCINNVRELRDAKQRLSARRSSTASSFALVLIRAEIQLVRANQKEREWGGEVAVSEPG